jgi:hypothetical protein
MRLLVCAACAALRSSLRSDPGGEALPASLAESKEHGSWGEKSWEKSWLGARFAKTVEKHQNSLKKKFDRLRKEFHVDIRKAMKDRKRDDRARWKKEFQAMRDKDAKKWKKFRGTRAKAKTMADFAATQQAAKPQQLVFKTLPNFTAPRTSRHPLNSHLPLRVVPHLNLTGAPGSLDWVTKTPHYKWQFGRNEELYGVMR